MSKLYEAIDSLKDYVLQDPGDEVTIDKVHIIYNNRDRIDLSNLKDRSLKLFNNDDTIIGYLYFNDEDELKFDNSFYKHFGEDCRNENINIVMIKYKNGEELMCSVYWNSFFYELDDNHYILLFLGQKDLV